MLPFNNTVKVHKTGEVDQWGIPVQGAVIETHKVRLDFNGQSYLVHTPDGKNIMFNAQIFFKGSVNLTYNDIIEYDSGINGIVKETPKRISPMIDLSGKVLYTQVKL